MGVLATAIYDVRNVGKVQHGDVGRSGAVAAQTTVLGSRGLETAFKGSGQIAQNAAKVANVASKAVNPLLCVGAGVRVLNDDDQYAALIEETGAMGTMFASEKLFKKLIANPLTQKDYEAAGKMASGFTSKLANWAKGLSKGKKTALAIAADLALVGVSILSYDIGKKAASSFSNREERAQALDYES